MNFEDLAWLLDGLAVAERTVDYPALCRAGREAHARILGAAAWLQDHPPLRERLRGATRWSAVDALDRQGTGLFHSCRPSYIVEAVVLEDGTLGACISRVLKRPRAAGEMIVGSVAGEIFGYSPEDEQQLLPQVRLAGWVLRGDGLDSAIAAERTETVRTGVQQLDISARERYEQAMAELDRALFEDASAWDEGVLRRQVNEPLVEQLNRQMRSGSLGDLDHS